jgi:glycerol-3-phosphate acyltransferase PlsY
VNVWLVAAGYLLGSIPFAFLIARRFAAVDVRQVGSGNVGAANVQRTAGWTLGLTVALLDIAKGAAAVLFALAMDENAGTRAATAFAAVVGHVYPVWLRFRGGKGVAVAAGAFGAIAPAATAIATGIFGVVIWMTRYVSLGSILAAAALPLLVHLMQGAGSAVSWATGAAALIVWGHRSNVRRLLGRRERRLGEPA